MPSNCLSLHLRNLRTSDTALSAALAFNLIGAGKAPAVTVGVGYADTTSWFCSRNTMTCPRVIDGMVVNNDTFHILVLYAVKLSPLTAKCCLPF